MTTVTVTKDRSAPRVDCQQRERAAHLAWAFTEWARHERGDHDTAPPSADLRHRITAAGDLGIACLRWARRAIAADLPRERRLVAKVRLRAACERFLASPAERERDARMAAALIGGVA